MPGEQRGGLHPLLLEPSYWRNRLRELRLARVSLVLIPRPELSSDGVEVEEFRVRAHDGVRLWGLRARSRSTTRLARVRLVGPSELPVIDRNAIERGEAELIFQERAGRKLEDRVLDVLRVCQVAGELGGGACRIELIPRDGERPPDEFLIACQLLADEAADPVRPLDDAAGWPAST